jgi:hypothetical protein
MAHGACPALPKDHIRREAGKVFANRVKDAAIKIQLLVGGKKMGEQGSQADPPATGHASSSQAPKNQHQDILGEPIAPQTD